MINVKRPAKNQLYIREKRLNPLGRTNSICAFLQIIEFKTPPATLCVLARIPSQEVSSCRPLSGSYIRHCRRHWQNRKHLISCSQWFYPASTGFTRVSPSRHLKDFSLEVQSRESSEPSARPRQIPSPAVSTAGNDLFRHHRCGYDSAHCIRASRICHDGLQPQIPRKALVCPYYLQRRQNWPFFVNGAKVWQYPICKRDMGILRANYRKTAQYYGLIQNTHPSGCFFLQQRYYPSPRREKHRICHCFQNVPTAKVANSFRPLPRIRTRLGSGGIYFSGSKFQERTPFYRHQAPHIDGAGTGAKKPFYLQRLRLSQGVSHQLRDYPGSSLALLLQQGVSGTPAAGIQEFFLHGSNSHQKLLGKRCVHGNDSLGIRPDSGFSISMLTQRVSTLEYLNHSQRALVAASRVGEAWQQQYPAASQTIPTAGIIL